MSSVGESMTRVMASMGEVATLVDVISQASREQATGIAQISAAVIQMDGGTQQNSALVEQAAAASQSLRMQATGLRTLVDRFSTAV